MQLLEEQAKQREEAIEAMQRALEKQRAEQEKLKEGLKDMGLSVDGGNSTQLFATPQAHPAKEGTAQINYLLDRDREHAERIRQLELEVIIAKETVVTKDHVTVLVKESLKQQVKGKK